MKMLDEIPLNLIAPCGIPCVACYAYLRKRKTCPSCNEEGENKHEYCRKCKIKNCASAKGVQFCSECPDFPCASIKHIDKRYRLKYKTNLIENGLRLKNMDEAQYLREEKEKWACQNCGGVINMHYRVCSECGQSLD